MVAKSGNFFPSTAKLYNVRPPGWRIASAGVVSSYFLISGPIRLKASGCCCRRSVTLERICEALREDAEVVEPAALVTLRPSEDDHLDPDLATHRAIAAFPRRVLEHLAVLAATILRGVVNEFVLAKRLHDLIDARISAVKQSENIERALLEF